MKFSRFARPKRVSWQVVLVTLAALAIATIGGVRFWYQSNLKPLNSASEEQVQFVVERGSGVADIAQSLEVEGLIKNATAFVWYVRGDQAGIVLQAGTYTLSPSMSVPIIVELIAEGRIDASHITLLPGRRLDETRLEMIDGGWSEAEVDSALSHDFSGHPLLSNKPAGASLEGYVYPDTYEVNQQTTPEALIERALDNFYNKLVERGLVAKLSQQGFSLHEAFTLASIIEEEAGSDEDKPLVAQVFLKRLEIGMRLEADATFRYAAAVTGEELSVSIDSPYNTRIHAGLPPGPIANFSLSSLIAITEPADTDYLYFVSGDDGTTYFSSTLEEHQRLTREHCDENCKLE